LDGEVPVVEESPDRPTTPHEVQLSLPIGSRKIVGSEELGAKIVKRYLRSRGLSDDLIETYDVRHAGTDVVFPYYEFDELVYWQTRGVMSKTFMFPPASSGFKKSDYLYGFDFVEPLSYVGLTEAIFDAITLHDQVLAVGGLDLSEVQIKKLKILNPKDGVILCPDNDAAGAAGLLKAATKLTDAGFKVFYSLPPKMEFDGEIVKDWNDLMVKGQMSRKEVHSIYENGVRRLTWSERTRLMDSFNRSKF
jgi:hypothetical protein